MANTVIGVYDNFAQAQSAMNQLLASGFTSLEVRLRPSEDTPTARAAVLKAAGAGDADTAPSEGTLRGFFRNLFGGDSHDAQEAHAPHADRYAEAVRRGSFVLTADATTEQQRDSAASIMEQFHPVDVDERATHWQASGWSAHDESAAPLSDDELAAERSRYGAATAVPAMGAGTASGASTSATTGTPMAATADTATQNLQNQQNPQQAVIPIVEEELKVGKRAVQRGGVRIVQRVVETPVQETLNLRQEHLTVERHAVDQPATAADLEAMKEGTLELRELAEEAVVSKTARVVEEVVIGKDVSETATTVSDTVRHTEVAVENLAATAQGSSAGAGMGLSSAAAGTGDDDFRSHWKTAYGSSGAQYDDYAPAYQYGASMAGDQRYLGHDWTTNESAIRSQWEQSHPQSAWDKVKDAVRYGWNRVAH